MARPEARYDGFLPGQHPVTAYGDGGFRFAEMSHRGSLLLLPSGVRAVEARDVGELSAASVEAIVAEEGAVELLLVGTGRDVAPLPVPLRDVLSAAGIRHETMQTGAAVRTYNVLLAEDRRVAALLIAV
ncbi:Mth938-like domain-containing protein [Pseudochelatococcus sp. B33]